MKILTPLTKSAVLCSLSVLLALGSFSRSLGQVSAAGSLAGTVVDPRGAVVVGAIVTVKNDATNQGFNTVTSGAGVFTIPSLGAGIYTATVSATGFKRTVVTDIKIDAGKPSSITVMLEVGAASESVTVTGGGELIQTQSANVNTTLVGRQITDIPTASRDALDLVLTMPGTATPGRPRTSTVNGLPKGALNIT
ncbi:MAG TPA: carboxypeptidase-like regulatory domain-containing protein, partial [Blastocatellia bacterium]|nr:carboxypeptidase-like regulatory domain-containing protein [Blastocatellia bacterium]